MRDFDCCGKSSLIANLRKELEQRNFKVFVSASSGGTPGSQAIRKLVKDADVKLVPDALCLMFAAGAADVAAQILEAGKTHDFILLDRWHFSSVAYQGAAGVKVSDIQDIYARFVNYKLPLDSSRCFYVDTPREERRRRMRATMLTASRMVNDRYETMGDDFMAKVESLYERQVQMGYLKRIDGNRTPEALVDDVLHRLLDF